MTAPPDLEAGFRAARDITRRHASSFYFSLFPLRRDMRRAVYAVYAFCRHADDAVDDAAGPGRLDGAIAGLRGLVDRLFAGETIAELPWAAAFQHTVRSSGIPRRLCDELIDGVALDTRTPVRIPDWPALRNYCYHVASVVGLMLSSIFGLRRAEARQNAADMGIAMQLTNILRDVVEDAARDRIYLPADELRSFGLSHEILLARLDSPEWRDYARFFAGRARDHYASAEAGIPALAPGAPQFAAWCMREIYAGILDEIERADFDVTARRQVPAPRKFALAWRAFRNWRRRR